MDAGSWEAQRGKGKFDVETGWAQKVVERWGVKPRHWTQMTKHARSCGETRGGSLDLETRSCKKMRRGNGGTRYEIKWFQEVAEGHRGGSLDIEARWMQEVVEEHRGGILDIETRWTQEVCGEARAGGEYRYWNLMNAGNVGSLMRGTRGEV